MKKIAFGFASIVACVVIYTVFTTNKEEEIALQPVSVAVEAGILSSPVFIAAEKGFFEEEGLDVEILGRESGRASFRAMLDGEVDLATVAPTPIMFESFKRQDFSIFATFAYSDDDIKFIVRKDRVGDQYENLVGRKIGTPVGTTGQFVVDTALVLNGINPNAVNVVDIAPSGLPQAILAGDIDALVIWEPHAATAKKLLGELGGFLPKSDVYRTTFNFVSMKSFAANNPEILTNSSFGVQFSLKSALITNRFGF